MRCTAVEKLLPLYVEGDLFEQEANEVRAHISSCEGCRRLAQEFQASQRRLQSFAAPEFDEEFYRSIRGAVLTEIRARPSSRPSVFNLFRTLFPLRPAFAASLAVLMVFGAVSLGIYYRLSKGYAPMVALEKSPREINPNQYGDASEQTTSGKVTGKATVGRERESGFASRSVVRRSTRPVKKSGAPPEELTPVSSNNPAAFAGVQKPEGNDGAASNTSTARPEAVARMELQTSDPNIRIIWLGRKASE